MYESSYVLTLSRFEQGAFFIEVEHPDWEVAVLAKTEGRLIHNIQMLFDGFLICQIIVELRILVLVRILVIHTIYVRGL